MEIGMFHGNVAVERAGKTTVQDKRWDLRCRLSRLYYPASSIMGKAESARTKSFNLSNHTGSHETGELDCLIIVSAIYGVGYVQGL